MVSPQSTASSCRPRTLNLQATDSCNSRCLMCHVWKTGKPEAITLDDLRRLLANPFFGEVCQVGVTGGESTLRKDLPDLFELLPQCLPQLRGASFITNGMLTDRAVDVYSRVNDHYREKGLTFEGMVSLDGVGEVHDRVRGRAGAFASASRTLLALKAWQVPVIAACTIIRSNVYGLHDLLDWGKSHGVYVRFRVAEFIRRLYNDPCAAEIRCFTQRELRHLVSFYHLLLTEYEKDETIRRTYSSVLSLLTGGERLIGCPYQEGLAVNLDSRGGLACCAPKGESLALPEGLAGAADALAAQRSMVAREHCAQCIHDYHDGWSPAALRDENQTRARGRELYEVADEQLTAPEMPAQALDLASLKQLLLVGWYGTETAGDNAILQGLITEYLQANPRLQFQVLSLYPYYTRTTVAGWPDALRSRVRVLGYAGEATWQATLDCDAVVMAGGPLMDIPETRKILCLFKRFADLDKPRVIEGCGVGPLHHAEYRWNVCRIARLATRISVRDRASREALRSFGIRKEIEVRPDPAVTFVRTQGVWHHGLESRVIRCFLRELTGEYPQSVSAEQAAANLAAFLGRLLEWYPDHRVELWAMHHFPVGNDDRLFARQLAARVANPRLTCDWEPRSPGEILEAMAGADFCVCMRFHSCVFAAEVGAPFLAIDYTAGGKIRGLLEDIGQEHRRCELSEVGALQKDRLEASLCGPTALEAHPAPGAGERVVHTPPRILHVIQAVTGGGGSRAMIALAKHAQRLAGQEHRAVSLLPADAVGKQLAREAGLPILDRPSRTELRNAMVQADIVLVHWWNNPDLSALFHSELPPMRLAFWLHVGGYHSPQVLTRPLIDFADLAVACSPHTYAHPVFASLPEDQRNQRTAMVLAGADFDRLAGVATKPHSGLRVGYIGTIDPVKMHADFVAMSCAVRGPDVKFVVCGGGDSRWLAEQAERLGRTASFEFKGHVEDLRPVLEALDVYGYPLCPDTYAAAELNLQEVMFAGLPVVAFPHGGIGRLIQHGETGLLVESPEAYSQAIEHLLNNPIERARLGANAAAHARRCFGAENAALEFNRAFDRLLAQPKRERRWIGQPTITLGGQTVIAVDAAPALAIHPGTRQFVESLEDGARPFIESLTSPDIEDLLAAEQRIAGLSRLMHYTGVVAYRNAHPKDPYLQLWAGLGFLHAGQPVEALGAFATALHNGLTHWRIHWYRALAADSAGQTGETIEALRLVHQSAPTFAPAREMLARFGSLPSAPSATPPSLVLPEAARGCVEQAELLFQQGQLQPARDWLERALDFAPDHLGLLEALCQADCELGNLPSARRLRDVILTSAPQHASPAMEAIGAVLDGQPEIRASVRESAHPSAVAGVATVPESAQALSGKDPLVSVLVSTYNSERYLRACLENLVTQTIADRLEILVIDSGSQENERAIVEDFQRRYPQIRYLRTERETLYAAWNRGLQMARGTYVANANSDDTLRQDALERLAAALDAHPEAGLAYGDYSTTRVPNDTFDRPSVIRHNIHPPFHPATLLFYCVTGCHPMWRRTTFDQVGRFDPSFTAPGDYEFVLRCVQCGLRAVHVPEILSLFYQNPDGLSLKPNSKTNIEFNRIQAKYRAEMPIDRLFKLDPQDPKQVSRGWSALGNMATQFEVPWFEYPCRELDFAAGCYAEALRQDPDNAAATHNLAVVHLLKGQLPDAEDLNSAGSPQIVRVLRGAAREGRLELIEVNLPPAVDPIEFAGPGLLVHPPVAFGTTAPTIPLEPSLTTPRPGPLLVRWQGAFLNSSGAACESLELALALALRTELGADDLTDPYDEAFAGGLPVALRADLRQCLRRSRFLLGGISISHRPVARIAHGMGAAWSVARTGFAADLLPVELARRCNMMDEVWVPSRFNLEGFAASGVERDKLVLIPGAVDQRRFTPAGQTALALPNRAAFNFLAVGDWSRRKGWDILLAAYLSEFSIRDDVCLFLRTNPGGPPRTDRHTDLDARIQTVAHRLGLGSESLPRVEILADPIAYADMPRLYLAADCVVVPARGGSWSRVAHEAMLVERPVIVTNWGSQTDFITLDNAFPLECELVTVDQVEAEDWPCREQRWAEPSTQHLRLLMRGVWKHPEEAATRGRRARADMVQRFSLDQVTGLILDRLQQIEHRLSHPLCPPASGRVISGVAEGAPSPSRNVAVTWEGAFLDHGSLAHVNRELTRALEEQPGIQLTRVGKNALSGEAAMDPSLNAMARRLKSQVPSQTLITVRHGWPPDWRQPDRGAWVLIQPWEFGVLPVDWLSRLDAVKEVWVPSEYARRVYVDSGVAPDKVKIVPNGVNPDRFHPEAAPLPLPTKKGFKFLFVGGTVRRKGPDVLLKAYLEAFTAADDVCLVIKDFGAQSVYAGRTFAEQIQAAQSRSDTPEILHLTDDLPVNALPGLYTACDCLVHPYRGEGFGLPVLEAMACGRPVIVTGGGATDDFAPDQFAWRIPALRVSTGSTVDGLKLARPGWLLEPDGHALVERLQWVLTHREEARDRGRAASAYAHHHWSWSRAAAIAAQRLKSLVTQAKAAPEALIAVTPPSRPVPAVARVGALDEARTHLANHRPDDAWRHTIDALRQRPFHPEAFLFLSEIALSAGDTQTACRCADRALGLAPRWEEARRLRRALPADIEGTRPWPDLEQVLQPGASPVLTVCLIVKDEARDLPRCLAAIRGLTRQIVVVDTGSTDRTIEIARAFGAEVHTWAWNDDFSAARNVALEHARGDWVLMLDADEELPAASLEALRRDLATPEVLAWRLPIVDAGKEAEGGNYVPRLFRNAPGVFYTGRIHEHAFASLDALGREWRLDNRLGTARLLHYGYSAAATREKDKISRNLRLLQLALAESPADPNLRMNLGLELMRSERKTEGLAEYRTAFAQLAALPPGRVAPELREALLSQFATHLLAAGKYETVTQVLHSPLARQGGLTASLHYLAGLALLRGERFGEAAAEFAQAVSKRNQPALTPVTSGIHDAAPHHCLAQSLMRAGRTPGAAAAFAAGLKAHPDSRPLRLDWARFQFEQGQPVEALQTLHELAGADAEDPVPWRLGAEITLSRLDFLEVAGDWTAEALTHHPRDSVLLDVRAEVLLLGDDFAGATALWRQTRLSQPRQQAALVACALLAGESPDLQVTNEPATSRAFVDWYRRWLTLGASALVVKLNASLSALEQVLPTAAGLLKAAVSEANTP